MEKFLLDEREKASLEVLISSALKLFPSGDELSIGS